MTDVLIFSPRPPRPFLKYYAPASPPLGIGYIANSLSLSGVSVRLYDLYAIPLTSNEITCIIKQENPKIVGCHVYTESCDTAVRIAKLAKMVSPSIVTVAGGPHASFEYNSLMTSSDIDIVVRFEAEETILDLWEAINHKYHDLTKIEGIVVKVDGKVIATPIRPVIENIDRLGFPPRSLYPAIERYMAPSTIISSRGCPYNCVFCGGANAVGKKFRCRSLPNIEEEIIYLKRLFPNEPIIFWDDAFGYDTKRLLDFCQMIRKINIKWTCGLRVDKVSKEILKEMVMAGCIKVNFGVESGVQEILDSSQKGITITQIENAVRWAGELGLYNSCSFVLPLPNDTEATIEESINFARHLGTIGATAVTFNAATPFPGTYLYERRNELGLKFLSKKWADFNFRNPIFETKNLRIDQIRRLLIDGLMLWHKVSQQEIRDKRLALEKLKISEQF